MKFNKFLLWAITACLPHHLYAVPLLDPQMQTGTLP